jgi:hypothetical protein
MLAPIGWLEEANRGKDEGNWSSSASDGAVAVAT